MKYLKITFVRVVLSYFGASMIRELLIANSIQSNDDIPNFLIIILAGLIYYWLTLYVNNRR